MPWLNYDNVHYETSGIMPQLVAYYGVDRVRYMLDEIGYERILFGSDHPTVDLGTQIAAVEQVVPGAHHDRVFHGNALRLAERFRWWGT
jgi:predicted TIM-barrel fold metal-dependent hydrolase